MAEDWGVVVDELKIFECQSGADWWADYMLRQPRERLTCLLATPAGCHWHVACDSRDDAVWLAETIVSHGVDKKFLKVARLSAARRS